MPTPLTVGVPASLPLGEMRASDVVPGRTYDHVLVRGTIDIDAGQPPTSFENCRIEGSVVTSSSVNLDTCTLVGGLYAYDTGGTIVDSLLDSPNPAAFRPGTARSSDALVVSTPWTVENSYLRTDQGTTPEHTEASQVLGGVGIEFTNVVFDTGGPFNNTQTADLNFFGKDLVCTDCWFVGYGGYALYSEGPNNTFVRPKFANTHRWGVLYPASDTKPIILDPSYLDEQAPSTVAPAPGVPAPRGATTAAGGPAVASAPVTVPEAPLTILMAISAGLLMGAAPLVVRWRRRAARA